MPVPCDTASSLLPGLVKDLANQTFQLHAVNFRQLQRNRSASCFLRWSVDTDVIRWLRSCARRSNSSSAWW